MATYPPTKTWLQNLKSFFHDPEQGTYLTMTPREFAQNLGFYTYTTIWFLIFNSALFVLTVTNRDGPYLTLESSSLGKTPGLLTRPSPNNEAQFRLRRDWNGKKSGDEDIETDTDEDLAVEIEQFIESQKHMSETKHCNETELPYPRTKGSGFCAFNTTRYGPCAKWPYGYAKDDYKPCLIIGFQKIFGFLPEPFTKAEKLPYDAEKLKPLIESSNATPRVLINCEPDARIELRYFPSHQGIDMAYFPHQDKYNKVKPGIAIQLVNLPRGITIRFICKIWYKGVEHNPKKKKGQIKFDVVVD